MTPNTKDVTKAGAQPEIHPDRLQYFSTATTAGHEALVISPKKAEVSISD